MVDITTLDHVVDMVLLKVKTRPNRKSRTCLMISDAQITLTKKNMVSNNTIGYNLSSSYVFNDIIICKLLYGGKKKIMIMSSNSSQTLFSIGLNQMITCFTLPFEPRAIALVFKKESDDGYCCVCLMLQKALTSLSVRTI